MSISAQEVNKLRKATGAGMMDCKKALVETEGDFDKAIDLLRLKGQKVSAKRADRETTEGAVFVKTNDDASNGYLVALGCETDFVAKNDEFVALGNDLLNILSTKNVADVTALKAESLANGEKVEDFITNLVGKIGEKIDIVDVSVVTGDTVVPYIHSNNKLGVLVSLNKKGGPVVDAGKDVAMQIAAMNPVALSKADVSDEVKERELALGRQQAIDEGKPEAIVDKIAQGKLGKFYKDNTLLEQSFVKDSSKSVSQMLNDIESGLTVSVFKRISIG